MKSDTGGSLENSSKSHPENDHYHYLARLKRRGYIAMLELYQQIRSV